MMEFHPAYLILLALVFLVATALFGKVLLHLYDQRASERHRQLEKALQQESQRLGELTRRVDQLCQALPVEYVKREDWMRFCLSIDKKLDRVTDALRNRGPMR